MYLIILYIAFDKIVLFLLTILLLVIISNNGYWTNNYGYMVSSYKTYLKILMYIFIYVVRKLTKNLSISLWFSLIYIMTFLYYAVSKPVLKI